MRNWDTDLQGQKCLHSGDNHLLIWNPMLKILFLHVLGRSERNIMYHASGREMLPTLLHCLVEHTQHYVSVPEHNLCIFSMFIWISRMLQQPFWQIYFHSNNEPSGYFGLTETVSLSMFPESWGCIKEEENLFWRHSGWVCIPALILTVWLCEITSFPLPQPPFKTGLLGCREYLPYSQQ